MVIKMDKRKITAEWFEKLRNQLCTAFELIEQDYAKERNIIPGAFERNKWDREGGGGGIMSVMKGNVFEKVGVNISTVHGEFTEEFRKKIPGAEADPRFFATGVSLVAHMRSPLVPAMHFNTRFIETKKSWFGGGGDLTPMYSDDSETAEFHLAFKAACDKHDLSYYPKFKKQCDEYFYLKHRNESRGVGGIFYDYLQNDFAKDFIFTQDVGKAILTVYPEIVRKKMNLEWTHEQREFQLIKRGRYVEFNLLYDRGTTFGLSTGGNVEAILMSMPPEVKWP
jgi:coproporphyrinogen III oxidase